MNSKEIMLKCTAINCDYMRLPAGKLNGYAKLTELYQRIANQSKDCARAWSQDRDCPHHEPAVDGFWHGVAVWAEVFGLSIGMETYDLYNVFVPPHLDFANYLKPGWTPELIQCASGTPGEVVMQLDIAWTKLVIDLTSKWGWFHHLKDMDAMLEARRLESDLSQPNSPTYRAYLKSDLVFLRSLFEAFPFCEETSQFLQDWLRKLEKEAHAQ